MRFGCVLGAWGLVALLAMTGCGGASEHGEPAQEPAFNVGGTVEIDPLTLLPNALQPEEGLLVGGQPTAEQLEQARDLGYETVINIRNTDEPGPAREEVEALGMSYVSIPVAGAEGISEENARALATALDEAEGPVIVHCGSGNRVGALFALKAHYVDGASAEESMQIGMDYGLTRLEPVVRERLELVEVPN